MKMASKRRAIIQRFYESAVDAALQALWAAVLGVIGTGVVVAWRQVVGMTDAWFHGLLGAALASSGVLVLASILVAIRTRRHRDAERLKRARFATSKHGLLDIAVNAQRSEAALVRELAGIAKEIERIGKHFVPAATKVSSIIKRGGPRTAGRGLRAVTKFSETLQKDAARMECRLPPLREAMEFFAVSHRARMELLVKGDQPADAVRVQREAYRELREATIYGLEGGRTWSGTVRRTPNVSMALSGAARRLVEAIDDTSELLEQNIALCDELIALADSRLKRSARKSNKKDRGAS